MALTQKGRNILIAVGAIAALGGIKYAVDSGIIRNPLTHASVVASKTGDLGGQEDAQAGQVAKIAFPSTKKAHVGSKLFQIRNWEWSAQLASFFANGGAETTQGSLMEKFGVNAVFQRTDSNDEIKKAVLECASQLHNGADTCTGTAAAGWIAMGDGAGGGWLADLDSQLEKAYNTTDYDPVIVGAVGRSNGEDALLGPAEWKSDPKTMLGKTIVGVIMDGDWNIALAYEGFNGLKNNPDLHTYDPTAVNWISAPDNDYIKAVTDVYNQNKCETRKVVIDGKPAKVDGKSEVQVCPDGVVTWTPGDEQAVHGREGTVKIISSHEYSAQMPATLFVIKKFAKNNSDVISGFLAATWAAADQLKLYDDALKYAAGISAKIYNDNNADYWYTYFKGSHDKKTGTPLGGSAVFNLQDNLQFFGLADGYQNSMKTTYETFARIDNEQYGDQFKKNPIPPYSKAVDNNYILLAKSKLEDQGVQAGAAETVDYSKDVEQGTQVGKAALYISFALNSDALTPAGKAQLAQLAATLGIAKSLAFEIDGYTDASGSQAINKDLSLRRATAVKKYLQGVAPRTFPDSRFKAVKGLGSDNPIDPNDPSKNRRVEIIQLGTEQ